MVLTINPRAASVEGRKVVLPFRRRPMPRPNGGALSLSGGRDSIDRTLHKMLALLSEGVK
jgi:hypothetical protein